MLFPLSTSRVKVGLRYRILQTRHWSASQCFRKSKTPRSNVLSGPARTRFAPSPTGYLHLGSLRTALFNYLLAKKTGGQFLLRVEDTDRTRTVPDAEEKLYQDLRWAGLDWDEGPNIGGPFGSYKQSQRTTLYRDHSRNLLISGHAYRCFCSATRLNELAKRRQQLGLPTDYDRTCAGLSKQESDDRAARGDTHVVRFRAPELYPELDDLVYGIVGKNKTQSNTGIVTKHGEIAYEDPILLKSDGHPTYHLANVVDDHHMQITHVVRATEWISSTPKHLALYEAFGWQPPAYAHVGLLVDEHGSKLSKRNLAVNVGAYRDMGVLPEALLNFVALLGWSHSQRSDIMDLSELIGQFQMKLTKGNNTVAFEKLWYLQKHHASLAVHREGKRFEEMTSSVAICVENTACATDLSLILGTRTLQQYIKSILQADSKMYTLPQEFVDRNIYFFERPPEVDIQNIINASQNRIAALAKAMSASFAEDLIPQEWRENDIAQKISDFINKMACSLYGANPHLADSNDESSSSKDISSNIKILRKSFHQDMRAVLMAGKQGPTLASTLAILGRDETLWRLQRCQNLKIPTQKD